MISSDLWNRLIISGKKQYADSADAVSLMQQWTNSAGVSANLRELLERRDDEVPKADYPAPKPGALALPDVLKVFYNHGLTCNSLIDRSNVVWIVANTVTPMRVDGRDVLDDGSIDIKIPLTALPGHGQVGPRGMAGDIISIHAMRCSPKFRESTAEMLVYTTGNNEIVLRHAYDWYVNAIHFAICDTSKLDSYKSYIIRLVSREDVVNPLELSVLMEFASTYSQWVTYDLDGTQDVGLVYVPNTSDGILTNLYKMPTLRQLGEIVQQYIKGYCDLDDCLRGMMTNPMVDELRITYAQYQELGRVKKEQQDSFYSMMSDAVLNLGFADEIERARNSLNMLTSNIDNEQENKDDNPAG